jgi:hypothetical protein
MIHQEIDVPKMIQDLCDQRFDGHTFGNIKDICPGFATPLQDQADGFVQADGINIIGGDQCAQGRKG